jgi:uncharacterized membrane protein YkvI
MFTPDEWRSILLLAIIGVLYLLRNTNAFFRVLWKIIAMFFIVLFATLMANYAKKEIKEWWNKD